MHVGKWQQRQGLCTASQADALTIYSAVRELIFPKTSRHCDSTLEGLGPMRQGVPIDYQSHEDQAAEAYRTGCCSELWDVFLC